MKALKAGQGFTFHGDDDYCGTYFTGANWHVSLIKSSSHGVSVSTCLCPRARVLAAAAFLKLLLVVHAHDEQIIADLLPHISFSGALRPLGLIKH